jgi:hypothetical protein
VKALGRLRSFHLFTFSPYHDSEAAVPHTCTQCGCENPEPANYCRRCGAPLGGTLRSATPDTPLMRKWRRLRQRLTRKEVRVLLGEPLGVSLGDDSRAAPPAAHPAARGADPALETWTYAYQRASGGDERITGQVSFSTADGVVVAWVEPDWTLVRAPDPPTS